MFPILSLRPRGPATRFRRIAVSGLAALSILALDGCGAEPGAPDPSAASLPQDGSAAPQFQAKRSAAPQFQAKNMGPGWKSDASVRVAVSDGSSSTVLQDKATGPTTPPPAVPRKIIYDATIDLVVDSLGGLEASVVDVVKRHGGFLSGSDMATQVSAQRTATWRVRVPVDRFEDFVRAIGRLGEVRTSHIGSQDVTEEYFDLEARIRNKQEEEKRLLKHLADSTGKLEDILKVEAELTRVRGEVEQMQGRLRFLANRADLSTVTITATELKNYTPPQPVTLATQINATFFGSLNALIALGEAALLVFIALVPWLPLIAIALFVAYRLYRASLKAALPRVTPSGPARP
jgi:hypothetical protein